MADKITGLANPEQGTSRRDFMAKVAVAAVTAGTTIPRLASAQAAAKPR